MALLTTGNKVVVDLVESMDKEREKQRAELKKQKEIKANWNTLRQKGFGYSTDPRHPVILDYEDGRMLHEVLPDNTWKDQRCFIIGGGESLKDFDFSSLKNELVIGVNRAYEAIDCTINFAMDHSLHYRITKGELGKEAKERFENFKGFPVWFDSAGYDYPKGIFILSKTKDHKFSYSMKDGISVGTNAGLGALNLAVCLGANPIYLLGFDMKGKDGKQVWWHDGYPEEHSDKIYKVFIKSFEVIAPGLKKKGFQVINLNPDSELKCFDFEEFKDIKPIKRPIIISYYTKETAYEEEVKYLKATLRRFNLENDVVGIPNKGSWHKNTYYKPKFILEMMKKHPDRSLVFVDADAKMRMNPILFNDLDYDFACHFRGPRKELLSGTLYFGNTKGARYLVDKWIEENKRRPKTQMPQKNLRAVFDREKKKIKWKALPVEYCMIYDSRSRYKTSPIIEHFQLSRRYKRSGGRKYEPGMEKSLDEIQKFCKGKDICLLGNANSILDEKKDINSFDIVCRMNRGISQGKEQFIGSRTDILFLSTGMSGENIRRAFKPRFVVWMTECSRLATSWVLGNAIQNPTKDWRELQRQLGINPSTGFLALNFLLKRIDFKSLTMYGFDFFETKTWYNTKIDSGQKHCGQKEKILIAEMIKEKWHVRLL